MNNNKTICEFLIEHTGSNPVSFHMPGHKGKSLYREYGHDKFSEQIIDWDITEIPGADNLFQPEDIIRRTMDRYKALYESLESYLLVNGSSSGLIAAIMTAVKREGKLIMARNSHKSIFNGLSLGQIEPVYAYPQVLDGYNISGPITTEEIERCIETAPDAEAVILPSPNYYGICSDIKSISETVHRHNKVLIVDQAHGAHLKFFDRHKGTTMFAAESLGADMVINSTHKTLASLTQSAVLNVCSDRVDRYCLEQQIQMMESTSPSYLLMASMDINADLIEKHEAQLFQGWKENLEHFYKSAGSISGLSVIEHPMLDRTKINLDMSALGIDGLDLEKRLMNKGIFPELVTGNILMCMTGIGNKRCDFDRLLQSLREISTETSADLPPAENPTQEVTVRKLKHGLPPTEKERIPLEEGNGRVCADSIIPYPPGIPIVCPGEIINGEIINYVTGLRKSGEKVMGIDDEGRIIVGK